jgi:transcriptional regulator with XRE-family HTH domain
VNKITRKPYYRDDTFLKEVGSKIRENRLKSGLTQMDLAFKCNEIDYSQINRLEQGKVNFSISNLKLISLALNVKVSDLLPND